MAFFAPLRDSTVLLMKSPKVSIYRVFGSRARAATRLSDKVTALVTRHHPARLQESQQDSG